MAIRDAEQTYLVRKRRAATVPAAKAVKLSCFGYLLDALPEMVRHLFLEQQRRQAQALDDLDELSSL